MAVARFTPPPPPKSLEPSSCPIHRIACLRQLGLPKSIRKRVPAGSWGFLRVPSSGSCGFAGVGCTPSYALVLLVSLAKGKEADPGCSGRFLRSFPGVLRATSGGSLSPEIAPRVCRVGFFREAECLVRCGEERPCE